jgi:twitching motility two-component system response regulator PilG
LRSDLREVLEDEGYLVVDVGDGKQALDYLVDARSVPPSLILLDLSMPQMTGWELLTVLKSYVRLTKIPVAVISGQEPQLDPVWHGAVAQVLRKPYDRDQLLALVAQHARPQLRLTDD